MLTAYRSRVRTACLKRLVTQRIAGQAKLVDEHSDSARILHANVPHPTTIPRAKLVLNTDRVSLFALKTGVMWASHLWLASAEASAWPSSTPIMPWRNGSSQQLLHTVSERWRMTVGGDHH
ncbi:MAG: hypothetical protein KGJ62_14485 [Armatimonadetes bacterium]|nr:hypothetical protein [Armatimonadota bacterium]MDE2207324.1 hypothetical protein [Armatimonadota bacterium]